MRDLISRLEERQQIRFGAPGKDGVFHGDHLVNLADLRAAVDVLKRGSDRYWLGFLVGALAILPALLIAISRIAA